MDVDVSSFLKRVNLYDGKTMIAARKGMVDNTLDLEKLAKQLAPLDRGDLTRSGVSGVVDTRGGIDGLVGFNEPYAVSVHEDMEPAPGATQRRGPLTLAKPGNEFGEAGGKYLQRPLRGKSRVYMRHLADVIKKVK